MNYVKVCELSDASLGVLLPVYRDSRLCHNYIFYTLV